MSIEAEAHLAQLRARLETLEHDWRRQLATTMCTADDFADDLHNLLATPTASTESLLPRDQMAILLDRWQRRAEEATRDQALARQLLQVGE